MQHSHSDYFSPIFAFILFIGLAKYNLIIGAITGTLAMIYTAIKLINEVKKKGDQNNNKADQQDRSSKDI